MNMSREDAIKWCIKNNCDFKYSFNYKTKSAPDGWRWGIHGESNVLEVALISGLESSNIIKLKDIQEYIKNDETNVTLWDERILGHDEAHVGVASSELSEEVNKALEVSIVKFRAAQDFIKKLDDAVIALNVPRSAFIREAIEEHIKNKTQK